MREQHQFSLDAMLASSGSTREEIVFRSWFLDECFDRATQAAAPLKNVLNGTAPMSAAVPGDAFALLAEIRRLEFILQKCIAVYMQESKDTVRIREMARCVADIAYFAKADVEKIVAWFSPDGRLFRPTGAAPPVGC